MGKTFLFPAGFLWGSATSAYQVEGGIDQADWSLAHPAGRAADHYNLYEQDFDWAKKLSQNAHRLSLEWSRIEPVEGRFDQQEIAHYRKVLSALKKRDMKTVVTLWHWTNPLWFAQQGGWAQKGAPQYFARYAELVTQELGDLVDLWVTLNEPMNHVLLGYFTGRFPPRKRNPLLGLRVFGNLVKAHQLAYRIIHRKHPQAQVSIAKAMSYFEPARGWFFAESLLARAADWLWNHHVLFRMRKELDYIGCNYYFHNRVIWRPPFFKSAHEASTDTGWEICPEGLYYVLKDLASLGKPVYVLENGIADAKDRLREQFITSHLYWTWKAIEEKVDVRGYFYWSLMDNFEWGGFAPRFGLLAVDYGTMKRAPRPSAFVYEKICRTNRLELEILPAHVCIQYTIH